MGKSTEKNESKGADNETKVVVNRQCGIVMPIAQMTHINTEYTESHWSEVQKIICEACVGYNPRLVSESKTSGMILTDIVQNLYKDDIVICDISGRNPNVFFELGMRLTFDKPTIVLKDDATTIPFDIQGVRMIIYPIGLNYHKINKLKDDISVAINDTFVDVDSSKNNTFLKHFKDFNIKPAKLDSQSITQDEIRLLNIENQLSSIIKIVSSKSGNNSSFDKSLSRKMEPYDWSDLKDEDINHFVKTLTKYNIQRILQDYENGIHTMLFNFLIEYIDNKHNIGFFKEIPVEVIDKVIYEMKSL